VKFDIERNQIVGEQLIERGKRIYKLRLYFRDFSGNADQIALRIKVDATELTDHIRTLREVSANG